MQRNATDLVCAHLALFSVDRAPKDVKRAKKRRQGEEVFCAAKLPNVSVKPAQVLGLTNQ